MTQALLQRPIEPLHSAPQYAELAPFEAAHSHLLVVQHRAIEAAANFIAELEKQPREAHVLCLGTVSPLAVKATFCANEADLADALLRVLAASTAGTRLYLAGDEAFIWRIQRAARNAGLLREQIAAMAIHGARSVFCVHCMSTHDYEAGDEVTCSTCRVRLGVRGHFSERLGAWLGVCADADQPYAEPTS